MEIKDTRARINASNAALSGSSFDDVNLASSSFRNADLSGAHFEDVNLSGVVIENADVSGMKIMGVPVQALIDAYEAKRR